MCVKNDFVIKYRRITAKTGAYHDFIHDRPIMYKVFT